jgi:hypothetical protein
MTTNAISTEIRGSAPLTLFEIISTEQDAEEWANLLDDFIGPDNDVYTRLLQRYERTPRTARLSS